jgi:RNA polymerase sigma-70 factor (ECF subfamily)
MIQPLAASVAPEAPLRAEAAPDEDGLFELVYRQMRSLANSRDPDFDDLVQDAVEQALRARSQFAGRSKFSTFTYQICHRTVLRRRRWYARWLKRFTLSQSGDLPEAPPAMQEDAPPTAARETLERAGRLQHALSRLPAKKRVVVVLHDLEGLPCEEIAVIVEAKLGTVRSRLRDGRRELLELLSSDPYFGEEVCS